MKVNYGGLVLESYTEVVDMLRLCTVTLSTIGSKGHCLFSCACDSCLSRRKINDAIVVLERNVNEERKALVG